MVRHEKLMKLYRHRLGECNYGTQGEGLSQCHGAQRLVHRIQAVQVPYTIEGLWKSTTRWNPLSSQVIFPITYLFFVFSRQAQAQVYAGAAISKNSQNHNEVPSFPVDREISRNKYHLISTMLQYFESPLD